MPDKPTIVPPTPTISQPSVGPVTPPPPTGDNSPGIDQVQSVFDKVYPTKGISAAPAETPPPPPVKPEEQPVQPPQQPEPDVKPPEPKPGDEHKMPSFLEEALKAEPRQPKPEAPPEEEFPEELPTFKTPEESKNNWRRLRENYKKLKDEVKTLKQAPPQNEAQAQRLAFLENQNKEMQQVMTRVGLEQSAEFQNNIIRPLYAAWNEAARLVKESGNNPDDLAKAMTLSGKAQFEALDTLFSEMPESAKAEVHDALRHYRRLEDARQQALANAPAAYEGIRKREMERQYAEVNRQRENMKNLFDNALSKLRDELKVEIYQRTNEPGAEWWNQQSDKMIETAKDLYMGTTDMNRVAMACLLAPAADVYRGLWLASQKKIADLEGRFNNEPVLSESGGNAGNPTQERQTQEDLNRPFAEVFLREFHKAQARGR